MSNDLTNDKPSALTGVVVAPGAYRDVVLGDSPSTYLRLGEPAGSRTFGSEVGSASATAVGSGITAGATGLISDAGSDRERVHTLGRCQSCPARARPKSGNIKTCPVYVRPFEAIACHIGID